MDYSELLEKYEVLLGENRRLTKENDRLKAQLGIAEHKPAENPIAGPTVEKSIRYDQSTDDALFSSVNNRSDSISKIKLFMSLFKGRDDVYARRWENKKKGTFGLCGRFAANSRSPSPLNGPDPAKALTPGFSSIEKSRRLRQEGLAPP